MSKIKYLVMGIESDKLGQMIGNLVGGEVEGPAEIIVLDEKPPAVFAIDGITGGAKQIDFEKFVSAVVLSQRKKLAETVPTGKLAQDIVRFNRGKVDPA